jgi:hypothetical protein
MVVALYRLLQQAAFDDRTVGVMTQAYEAALRELQLVDRTDPLTELVATRIIEVARMGERDPARLCELAIKEWKE